MVSATLAMAVLGVILGAGVLFEAGRRIGKAKAERKAVEEDIADVEDKLDNKFNDLESRLKGIERVRKEEHGTVIKWLTRINKTLTREGYDVTEPDAVRRTIDVNADKEDTTSSHDDD